MLMVQRAASVAKFTGATGSEIKSYTDLETVSVYARDALNFSLNNGLIVGNEGLVRPRDNISRAETATVILRFLQEAGLMDIRTTASQKGSY